MAEIILHNPQISWSDLLIRHVRAEDLPALEWGGEYTHFRRLYSEAFRRAQMGLSVLWVADLTGHGIIGQVFVQLKCDRPELCNGVDRAYLYAFRVKEEFRSQGVGARLLTTVEDDLRHRGFHFLTLNVARVNERALSFYLRHGFHIVAPEPGHWSYIDHEGHVIEVHEPAWRMEKPLY